jgi:hypothetical protein
MKPGTNDVRGGPSSKESPFDAGSRLAYSSLTQIIGYVPTPIGS